MKIVCICGATATGKTEVALNLAKHLGSEIISFDSVQIYKYFDIGAAKPSRAFRHQVHHHLVDFLDPDRGFTAGDFKREAEKILGSLSARGSKYAVLVGGTGFYLQALLKGMYEIPKAPPEIKAGLIEEEKKGGLAALYAELQKRDSPYARKIHPNDAYRILRALEVMRSGSKTMTEIQKDFFNKSFPYPILLAGLQRTKSRLRELVKIRAEKMLAEGLVEETRKLSEKYPGARPLESVGYKETRAHLQGEIPFEELAAAVAKSTVLLAKRQTTWFKRDNQIQWFDPDEADPVAGILTKLSELTS